MRYLNPFVVIICLLLVKVSFAAPQPPAKPSPANAVSTKPVLVKMKNEMVGNNKVWIPDFERIPFKANVEIELNNPLTEPHGFELDGYIKPVVVPAKSKMTVKFTANKLGPIVYKCHMHPAHVGGVFKVVSVGEGAK